MRRMRHGLLLLLAGFGLGVAGNIAAGAQQVRLPGLYVAMLEVGDGERFRTDYAVKVPDTLAPFGGQIIAGGGRMERLEGEPLPGRPVIIRFPTLAAAEAWYASDVYGAIRPVRQATARTRSFLIEGRPSEN